MLSKLCCGIGSNKQEVQEAKPTSEVSSDHSTVCRNKSARLPVNTKMSEFNTILIIGATSGLGREFARRYHARGKKIIATGRRAERLAELKRELRGIETFEV